MKLEISEEECLRLARLEEGHEIGAGLLAIDPTPASLSRNLDAEALKAGIDWYEQASQPADVAHVVTSIWTAIWDNLQKRDKIPTDEEVSAAAKAMVLLGQEHRAAGKPMPTRLEEAKAALLAASLT